VVVTGHVGPNAFRVLSAAEVPIYRRESGTVRQAVEAFREGRLPLVSGATNPEHAGLGQGGAGSSGVPSAEASRQEEIAR
jgi:predicted Fe-Mo cluster-binding NifX family protein